MHENGSLDPALFSHEAHIRLAWIHITKYGLDKASYNIVNQLQEYVKLLAVEDKFNLTLTIASLKIVHHFMNKTGADTFAGFIEEFPMLITISGRCSCGTTVLVFKKQNRIMNLKLRDIIIAT